MKLAWIISSGKTRCSTLLHAIQNHHTSIECEKSYRNVRRKVRRELKNKSISLCSLCVQTQENTYGQFEQVGRYGSITWITTWNVLGVQIKQEGSVAHNIRDIWWKQSFIIRELASRMNVYRKWAEWLLNATCIWKTSTSKHGPLYVFDRKIRRRDEAVDTHEQPKGRFKRILRMKKFSGTEREMMWSRLTRLILNKQFQGQCTHEKSRILS